MVMSRHARSLPGSSVKKLHVTALWYMHMYKIPLLAIWQSYTDARLHEISISCACTGQRLELRCSDKT